MIDQKDFFISATPLLCQRLLSNQSNNGEFTSMKTGVHHIHSFLFLLIFLLAAPHLQAQSDSTHVLFIGNSITYFNNMPEIFKGIANNKGKKVAVDMYAPGGTGFVNHYNNPNVFAKIRKRAWDVVILQPGSSESAAVSWPVATTVSRGKTIMDSIYQYSPCAKIFLYQIPYGVPAANNYATYFQVQTLIKNTITQVADGMKIPLLPAGECARAYYSKHQNLLLHSTYNDIHPNANGSFLVAASFYAGIFQDSLSNCTFYSTVPPDTAKKFFKIADTVVLNNFAQWRINTYNLHADFDITFGTTTMTFNNNSVNYTKVEWNFGDNTTSSQVSPTHTYTQGGTYKIVLKVFDKNNCVDSTSKEIVINDTSIPEENDLSKQLKLFPNPTKGKFQIQFHQPQWIQSVEILSATGQQVYSEMVQQTITSYSFHSPLPPGIYWIKLNMESSYVVKKLIYNN